MERAYNQRKVISDIKSRKVHPFDPRETHAQVEPTRHNLSDILGDDIMSHIQSFRGADNAVIMARQKELNNILEESSRLRGKREAQVENRGELERERVNVAEWKRHTELMVDVFLKRSKLREMSARNERAKQQLRDRRTAERQNALAQFPERFNRLVPHSEFSGPVTNSMDPRAAAMD